MMLRINGIKNLISIPGWIANSQISSTEVRELSSDAWSTITTDPTMHRRHPSIPIFCSFSFNKKCAKTALSIGIHSTHILLETFRIKKKEKKNHQEINLPNNNAQCTKRRYKRSRGKNISYKIGYFSNNHCQFSPKNKEKEKENQIDASQSCLQ